MYNPSLHTATNKPIGLTNKPVDARTYYYDPNTFTYRPYVDTSEVVSYLIGNDRVGQFSVIVAGVSSGYTEWWFKDGIADADLVQKGAAVWGDIIGDINNQADLISLINGRSIRVVLELPSGSPLPFHYDFTEPYNLDFGAVSKLKISSKTYKTIYDIEIQSNYTTTSLETIDSIDIYGHDSGDGLTTQDDVRVILYILKYDPVVSHTEFTYTFPITLS